VGLLDSEIGHGMEDEIASSLPLYWAISSGAAETDDHRIDTICYPGYPTSYKPDAVAFGHSPVVNPTSRLRSITYPFHWPSGTPSAYVYIINESYSVKIIPAAAIFRSEGRREDSG
jgi:hypothetical protein